MTLLTIPLSNNTATDDNNSSDDIKKKSSEWQVLIRSDLSGVLALDGRFLRGSAKGRKGGLCSGSV